jgi:hypothetical protein
MTEACWSAVVAGSDLRPDPPEPSGPGEMPLGASSTVVDGVAATSVLVIDASLLLAVEDTDWHSARHAIDRS